MKDRKLEKMIGKLDSEESFPGSGEQDPRWRELQRIGRMMRQEPAMKPPAGLGERVMSRVRAHRPSPWQAFVQVLMKPRVVSFHPLKALSSPVSGQECSFYFIMAGVFYSVLAVVLTIGFHELGTGLIPPGWVRWQPQIALITAVCMVAMGFYILKDGQMARRVARIVALVYLGFALLNGVVVPLEWDIPVSAFISMLSTLIGVPTGFFLIRTIQNCGKWYAQA